MPLPFGFFTAIRGRLRRRKEAAQRQTDIVACARSAEAGDAAAVARLLGGHPEWLGARGGRGPEWLGERDADGWTLLHIAAARGHLQVVDLLLDLGADTAARDHVGATPLHW